jgi:hypothetical protein
MSMASTNLTGTNVRELRAAAADADAEGVSLDEHVHIDSVGLRDFTVFIADGTLDALDDAEFDAEFRSAVIDLIADWREVTRLSKKDHIYGR